ncbi:hypothetical protein XELAEV_18047702mg [Xenopus laevis]|uniref:Uncharacterized protein n=1 Tax=Xenopus laevis TaxID=8355 RepID=A0A974BVK8_XENLA|nr:hypothetical protein XELAEV_18047702mg [Xenopus laevis]
MHTLHKPSISFPVVVEKKGVVCYLTRVWTCACLGLLDFNWPYRPIATHGRYYDCFIFFFVFLSFLCESASSFCE